MNHKKCWLMHLEELVMKLIKYKLGELIKQSDSRNNDRYDITHVKGISVKKEFIETRADMNGVSLKPYKIVSPDYYAYVTVTSRNGEKITIAHNDTDENYIVSSSYIVFSPLLLFSYCGSKQRFPKELIGNLRSPLKSSSCFFISFLVARCSISYFESSSC